MGLVGLVMIRVLKKDSIVLLGDDNFKVYQF